MTLATLSDNSPPPSHGDPDHGQDQDQDHDLDDNDDDDDDNGGVSLADYQHFMEAMPATHETDGEEEEQDEAWASLDSPMQQLLSQAPAYLALHPHLEILVSSTSQHNTSTTLMPAPPVYMSHLSSGDPALEPPPTLNEPHLSIQDKDAFCPITSYFQHHFDPTKAIVPGLDFIQVPKAITQDDLQCDRYDYQGIDWEIRKTMRSAVREARFEFESGKLSPRLRQVRKVGNLVSTP